MKENTIFKAEFGVILFWDNSIFAETTSDYIQ